MVNKKTDGVIHKTIQEHHHTYWHFDKVIKSFLIFMVALIVISNTVGVISNSVLEDQIVYKKCVDGCSAKHFAGIDVNRVQGTSCIVEEFDRTDCIDSCNRMFMVVSK